MKPSPIDLACHLDDQELVFWRGRRIDVWKLYDTLTGLGWKVDTEESNLMNAMSRTWRNDGIKVWITLQEFVCAPPDGEVAAFEAIRFFRFDPALMPVGTMIESIYEPGDEGEDWYPQHREEWSWLIDHGDPQSDTHALLQAIPLRDVPESILAEAWLDVEEAIDLDDEHG
ncbi:MAG: hypothetical protein Q8O67_11070 [Deltaproteobacteria bacterium]|nr:hypothetical protein [Deltaproteobacteria bacterium]